MSNYNKAKYKAVPVDSSGIHFDSKIEQQVFELMCLYWGSYVYPNSHFLGVHRSLPITERHSTEVDSVFYPFSSPVTWKPDFCLWQKPGEYQSFESCQTIVEVKGVFTSDFGLKLRLLAEQRRFDFRRLIIVTQNRKLPRYCKHLRVFSLVDFRNFVKLTDPYLT